MALIDLSNYKSSLAQSTASRSGDANGNIYFDVANGRVELITAEEQAFVDLTNAGTPTGAAGVAATATVSTTYYKIVTPGDTDWTLIGAASSTAGLIFQATGAGAGTGTCNECTANPLVEDDGIKFEACYAFERQERRVDEVLRQYDYFFAGTFKFGGAYEIVNGRKFDDADGSATSLTTDDRFKLRGSGWIEKDGTGATGRIFYGGVSLGNIEALSQPYYQLSEGGAPVNFDKDGPINEAIQVFGDNSVDANAYATTVATAASQTISVVAASGTFTRSAGDFTTDGFIVGHRFTAAGLASNTGTYTVASVTALVITIEADEFASLTDETGDADEVLTVNGIDTRTYLSLKVRTFGNNFDEKILADSGVAEMGGYSTGFALGESTHLTSGSFTLADVYTAQVSPWTGMTLEKLASAQIETGFNEADGNFTWTLNNTANGSLNQCVAFLDALAQTDDDIDSGAITVTNGKRVGTWYSYNAQGQIVTDAPFASEGLFIEQIPTADQQRVVFTDDAADLKTYPFNVGISVTVGANAVADVLAWYHAFFLDGPTTNDFNTANALTVEDNTGTAVKGNVSTDAVGNDIVFTFDYDGDTIGGTAGTEKDVVFECEGDGGVTAAKTVFTISRTATISVACTPSVEANV